MKIKIIYLAIVFQILTASDKDSSSPVSTNFSIYPSLRSISIESSTSILFVNYSSNIDVDLFHITNHKISTFGLRAGVAQINSLLLYSQPNAPFAVEYQICFRTTSVYKNLRGNAFIGGAHFIDKKPFIDKPLNLLKFGIDVRWIVVPPIFGLFIRCEGYKNYFALIQGGISVGYFD